MSLEIFYLKVDELTPYSKNTRKHAEKDVRNIKKSIADYGMNDPIGIWSDKNIIVIYDADRKKAVYPFMPYIKAEKEYIRQKQAKAEKRNRMRKFQKRCDVNG